MSDERLSFGAESFSNDLAIRFDKEVAEILTLSAEICSIPGVTVPASAEGLAEVIRTARVVRDYAENHGLQVIALEPTREAPYPFLIVTFAEHDLESPEFSEAIALIGHLDVVKPKSEGQFSPFVDGDDFFARGATDMKTVVSTYLVWMVRRQQQPGPKPPIILTFSCTEENGGPEPHHTLSALRWLRDARGVVIRFAVVGERTGELEWMKPEPLVGPVCAENRSWRWIRIHGGGRGVAALESIAETIRLGRSTIARLNDEHTPAVKTERQPGVRSGFVNPFCIIAGDEDAHSPGAVWLTARRIPGTAIHSAQAKASDASLIENFQSISAAAAATFGEDNVRLAGVEIGEDRNFNTYDGSGMMRLTVFGTDIESASRWAAGLDTDGIEVVAWAEAAGSIDGETLVGIDIRELLDHKDEVERLIDSMGETLSWGNLERVIELPPWRCPDDHPDLIKLRAAWERTVGEPSADLVKLHGNDGGHLAAIQQEADDNAARYGIGHAVVFGQVGSGPHGPKESARATSIRPYLDILDRWADSL